MPERSPTTVYDPRGLPLDARFFVTADQRGLSFTIQSRGGSRSGPSARNSDYDPALELLLSRLATLDALIVNAEVVSARALRDYPNHDDRRLGVSSGYPIRLRARSMLDLRREFGRAQRKTARSPSLTSSGNNNKRVRFDLEIVGWEASALAELEQVLSCAPHLVDSDQESPPDLESGRRQAGGQGFLADPAMRRAVELHAMQIATEHFEKDGWQVADTSSGNPYDLEVTREGVVAHIEVKGTTGEGRRNISL